MRNVRVFETTIDITLDFTGLGVSPSDVSLPDADRDDAGDLIVRALARIPPHDPSGCSAVGSAQSIGLTTANWSEQERVLGLQMR